MYEELIICASSESSAPKMEPLEGAVGRRVKLSLHDGTNIDGFVHSYSGNAGKLSIEKVECIENGKKKKLVGLQHYFAEEISDLLLLEDVCKNKKKIKTTERDGGRGNGGMLRGKCITPHLDRLAFVEPSSLVLKAQKRDDRLTSSGNETCSSDSDMDLPQAEGYTIIPKLCNTFYEAIAYIMKHQVVAVAMEGVAIGRFGRLCWLQIAVPDHVFMFDILSMGRACFEEGIKDILENQGILKVLHDCRMVSDLLHHQYDINIINVFDTQFQPMTLLAYILLHQSLLSKVANVFVYRLKHHNDWPRYVDGLGSCLVHHLDLPMEEVNWAVVRERRREEDEKVWMERPPQRHLAEAAVKNVKHLLDLRTVLMEKMMEEFVAGVNIYLMHVRDASDQDSKRYQTTPHLLPVAFQDIRAFMSSYHGRNHQFNVTEVRRDMNGFRENCTAIVKPDLYYSKDSIWHGGVKKTVPKTSKSNNSVKSEVSPSPEISSPTPKSPVIQSQEDPSVHTDNPVVADKAAIPFRKNLHTSMESDLVSKTVASMNAKKLVTETGGSHVDLQVDETFYDPCRQSESKEEDIDELKGGSLMRALIHEQDTTGNEARTDMEQFSITPAGKMICVDKKKKTKAEDASFDTVQDHFNPQFRHHSLGYTQHSRSNGLSPTRAESFETRDSCDNLRPVIPGGDLATYSPPKRRFTPQEQSLIENLKKSQQIGIQKNRLLQVSSSDDDDLSRTSFVGQNGYNEGFGRSSVHPRASDPSTITSVSRHLKESGYSSPSGVEIENQSTLASSRSQPTSPPSDSNSKLQVLLQKLKKQSL